MHAQPTLFVSHGAPTFALQPGRAGPLLAALGRRLPGPRAVLIVSPHWMTRGLAVAASPRPATIHASGGFPAALYALQYPAARHPAPAARVAALPRESGPRGELAGGHRQPAPDDQPRFWRLSRRTLCPAVSRRRRPGPGGARGRPAGRVRPAGRAGCAARPGSWRLGAALAYVSATRRAGDPALAAGRAAAGGCVGLGTGPGAAVARRRVDRRLGQSHAQPV